MLLQKAVGSGGRAGEEKSRGRTPKNSEITYFEKYFLCFLVKNNKKPLYKRQKIC